MLMTPFFSKGKVSEHDDALFLNAQAQSYKVSVKAPGFGHFIYYDLELPEARMEASRNGLSATQRLRDTQIIRAYTHAFFSTFVQGQPVNLLDAASNDYPEVTIKKFGPPGP